MEFTLGYLMCQQRLRLLLVTVLFRYELIERKMCHQSVNVDVMLRFCRENSKKILQSDLEVKNLQFKNFNMPKNTLRMKLMCFPYN